MESKMMTKDQYDKKLQKELGIDFALEIKPSFYKTRISLKLGKTFSKNMRKPSARMLGNPRKTNGRL